MARLGVHVDVQAGGVAVVGRPLAVTAIVTAERDVELTAVALAYVGHWWRRSLVPTPAALARDRGKDVWSVVTPVTRHTPVRLRAGERRWWTASLGPAPYPTLPDRGMRLFELRHDVEAAVSTAGSFRPRQATRAVDVRVPRGLYPGLAGRVAVSDPQVPAHAVAAEAMPGGWFVVATMPGAEVELVREERTGQPFGPVGRRRRSVARVVAGADGVATLPVPPDAHPTVRHGAGELRWVAVVRLGSATTVVDLDVYQVP